MIHLTTKQQTVLEFIHRYLAQHGCAPLIREIQEGCQIASYKSALDRLNALEHKGFIRRLPSKHRGIRVARKLLAPQPSTAISDAPPAFLEGVT